jgi:hypothetical protein
MWIEVSKIEGDQTKSWLRRVPVPRNTGTRQPGDISLSEATIYKHAIYWSIVTVSHIGVGDITAITVSERAFNCFVVLMGTFTYAILFGNMASLVSDLTSALKTKLHSQYQFVMNFLTKKKLKNNFYKQVDEYFNHIWTHNLGFNDNELLDELPANLKSDIRLAMYAHII